MEKRMARLNGTENHRILEILGEKGYFVKYEGEEKITIIASGHSGYQFVIDPTDDGIFITNERPGIQSDAGETFHRNNFDQCIAAMKEWTNRIIEKQNDWILDEFGGAADINPELPG
jgi:hypothetical protein